MLWLYLTCSLVACVALRPPSSHLGWRGPLCRHNKCTSKLIPCHHILSSAAITFLSPFGSPRRNRFWFSWSHSRCSSRHQALSQDSFDCCFYAASLSKSLVCLLRRLSELAWLPQLAGARILAQTAELLPVD